MLKYKKQKKIEVLMNTPLENLLKSNLALAEENNLTDEQILHAEALLRATIKKLNKEIRSKFYRYGDYSGVNSDIIKGFAHSTQAQNEVFQDFREGISPYKRMQLSTLYAYNQYLGAVLNCRSKTLSTCIDFARYYVNDYVYRVYRTKASDKTLNSKEIESAIQTILSIFGNSKLYMADEVLSDRLETEEDRRLARERNKKLKEQLEKGTPPKANKNTTKNFVEENGRNFEKKVEEVEESVSLPREEQESSREPDTAEYFPMFDQNGFPLTCVRGNKPYYSYVDVNGKTYNGPIYDENGNPIKENGDDIHHANNNGDQWE